MRKLIALFFCISTYIIIHAQKISWLVSGPMLGHTEFRTSKVWLEMKPGISSATLGFSEAKPGAKTHQVAVKKTETAFPNIFVFNITGLEPETNYNYTVQVAGQQGLVKGNFSTVPFWQWRSKPLPSFSFITGSCAYFNEPQYDRVGKPYGGDSSIFETMAKEKSDFMLWLGDNWYTRVPDYYSEWGLQYRASRDRSLPVMQNLLKAMPHYAIWDDHDYGPNDADKAYILKNESREVFKSFWANPSYGMNGQGIYTKVTWNDAEIFMLDDRWFRSSDDMPDSIEGMPNAGKRMFGEEQMEWLKNGLLMSNGNRQINFRIIATGSQVLNPMSPWDCFKHFSYEYNELMNFIKQSKIEGIIFLTGDRHHSEIIKTQREGAYPLYDITSSPLTSGIGNTKGSIEEKNPYRVGPEIDEQNYARLSFGGQGKDREMKVEFMNIKGVSLYSYSIKANELKIK